MQRIRVIFPMQKSFSSFAGVLVPGQQKGEAVVLLYTGMILRNFERHVIRTVSFWQSVPRAVRGAQGKLFTIVHGRSPEAIPALVPLFSDLEAQHASSSTAVSC